jgi:hypothetical protein
LMCPHNRIIQLQYVHAEELVFAFLIL